MDSSNPLFVYNWVYKGGTVVYGDCLDTNGNYKQLEVRGYLPFCYVEGVSTIKSSVVPVSMVYKRMLTSLDTSTLVPFYKVSFSCVKKMQDFARELVCYMHDIDQTTMFLSLYNLDNVGWLSIPNNKNRLGSNNVVTIDKIASCRSLVYDKPPYTDPKVMAFDIEVLSSDLTMPKAYRLKDTIEMISVAVCKAGGCLKRKSFLLHTRPLVLGVQGATEIVCKDECDMINKFFELVKSEDPDIITGYNIYGFDFDYILSRLQLYLKKIPDVSRGHGNSVNVIKVDWASNAYGHNKYQKLVIGGRLILDMFLYFKRMKLDKYSLDFVSKQFLGEGKISMPFTDMNNILASSVNVDELRNVAQYCLKDSELVLMLFDKVDMWIDVCEVSKITRTNIEDIYTRGEQMKVVAQCVKECVDRGIVLKPQPTDNVEWHEYEGAHVIEPKKGLYKNCVLLDFQSLYPSIIIAFNICPSTYTTDKYASPAVDVGLHRFRTDTIGLFPGMIKRLLEERKAVKKLMSACDKSSMTYTVLNRRQNALKVCANSVYGIMGFKNSRYFGHVGCAESVTAVGRIYLGKVIDYIKDTLHMNVIYGDTDSCMIQISVTDNATEVANNICKEVNAQLPSPMALMFESYYKSVMLLSKKRYIMLDDRGKINYKGVISARRDYCKYAKETFNNIVSIIAKGDDDDGISTIQHVIEYIDNRIFDLFCGNVDLHELVLTKSVRHLGSYKVNQPHVLMARRLVGKGLDIPPGTRLEYVFVQGGSTQADKMRTPEEVEQDKLEIDALYYIEKQLITQIDDVLQVVGINGYIKNRYL